MNNKFDDYEFISYLDLNTEIKGSYISEENYEEDMHRLSEPYIKKHKKSGYIKGIGNLDIYYEKYIAESPKGNIVICHGFGEFTEKYNELIYYFLKEGYSVFIIEHRGNGRSKRLGGDNCQISVERFDNYIEDFRTFIDTVVIPESNGKNLLLFAHSMGGGIASAFIEKYPEYFKGAVMSSPMHEINTGKYPKIVASTLSAFLTAVGKGNQYLPGQKPYTGVRKFPSRSTSSEHRYNYQYNLIKNNKPYQTGGSSAKWYCEALKATRKIVTPKNAGRVAIPVMILQAELDTHVIPRGHYRFAKNAGNCRVVIVRGSKHESYYENDNITFHVIDKIMDFYNGIS
ncbi:MAG: alpha/beta hydrolase [Clostridium sp.]|nr:alpha/beta hydrolase [Clostridium sp.]